VWPVDVRCEKMLDWGGFLHCLPVIGVIPRCSVFTRHLHTRVSEHLGITPITDKQCKNPPQSRIFSRLTSKGHTASIDDFEILASCSDDQELLIHESFLISKMKPSLNVQGSSIPLHLF
jgi:hypothetical protein